MAEIVNLRRARKARGRVEKDREAEANRIKHGVAKPVRALAKAQKEKASRDLEERRLTNADETEGKT